jgi:hypothetical protein
MFRQFQSHTIFLDVPDAIFKSEVEKQREIKHLLVSDHSELQIHQVYLCEFYCRLQLNALFISLTSSIRMLNSMTVLYKASLLTDSYAFSKSINNLCIVPLYDQQLICCIEIHADDP